MKNINIAIIGGGVAGLSCAIYVQRANAQATIYEQGVVGGLTATIDKIDNYPSYTTISGYDLANNMYEQATSLGAQVKYRQVVSVNKTDEGIVVATSRGSDIYDAVIVATGTRHNKLGIASEDALVGAGISYCATCDGNFHRGKSVAVVGSGNSAVKEALYLAGIASSVTLVCPQPVLTGDSMAIDSLATSGVTVLYNTSVIECLGSGKLSGITVVDSSTNATSTIELSGLFVAVGSRAASELLNGAGVDTDNGFVVVDSTNMTSVPGIFSAGDVTNGKLRQIVTACGAGATAGNYAVAYARKQAVLKNKQL